MQDKKTDELFEMARLVAGRLQGYNTPQEDVVLSEWLAADPKRRQFYDELAENVGKGSSLQEMVQFDRTEAFERFLRQTQPKQPRLSRYRIWAAATLLLGLLYTGYMGISPRFKTHQTISKTGDIAPGGNKATLTLSSGQRIDLSSGQEGIVIRDSSLTYMNGTALNVDVPSLSDLVYFTLETPKGGKYRVVLPDGSKVWLNADSRLVYPNRFVGSTREVDLIGEAYFDVFSDPDRPFHINSGGQRVDVLGTAFNVSAYPDENVTRTTLVRGAVKVRSDYDEGGGGVLLLPGEESVMEAGNLSKRVANIEAAISWKEGRFCFANTPLDAMMRQLSRWYDITVAYEQGIPDEYFTGKMSQRLHLMEVLDFLEGSGIKFRLEDRTLIISKI